MSVVQLDPATLSGKVLVLQVPARCYEPSRWIRKPKVWSDRWFKESSKTELMRVRNILVEKLMDYEEDMELRIRIHNELLPQLDAALHNK